MNLITQNELSMTSLEISELVKSRHTDVKRSIERLIKKGVIHVTPMAFFEKINNLGHKVKIEAYIFKGEQGKRDSIIVIAQLCPEYTAKIVDRWQELEQEVAKKPALPNFENPVEAARAWADAKEETLLLSEKVGEMKVDVKALDRIANADGYMTLRNAAKHLQYPPIKFNLYLNSISWIYKPRHAKEWIAYQDKIKAGYLIHKISTYKLKDGTEMISEQVLVTAKGICYLAKQLSNQLMVA